MILGILSWIMTEEYKTGGTRLERKMKIAVFMDNYDHLHRKPKRLYEQ
jgi:hypothetical protein